MISDPKALQYIYTIDESFSRPGWVKAAASRGVGKGLLVAEGAYPCTHRSIHYSLPHLRRHSQASEENNAACLCPSAYSGAFPYILSRCTPGLFRSHRRYVPD